MAFDVNSILNLLMNNLAYIILVGIIGFVGYMAYNFFRKIPKNPDYVKIFNEKDIEDEKYNKPDNLFDPKFLFRGERLLGRIVSYSEVPMLVNQTPEDPTKYKEGKEPTVEVTLCTAVFKGHTTGRFYFGKKTQIKWLKDDIETTIIRTDPKTKKTWREVFNGYEGRKVIIPSHLAITALGQCYFIHQSLPSVTKSIEANWSRRFTEAQANAFGQQMLKVSGFITEYAQDRRLRELEIEKLRAEKQLKMGNVI